MKTVEIRGFWGLLSFIGLAILTLGLLVGIPIGFVWVLWNALVGDILQGPYISFVQASMLTAIMGITFYLVFQPQITLQVKKAHSPEELEKRFGKMKDSDSH